MDDGGDTVTLIIRDGGGEAVGGDSQVDRHPPRSGPAGQGSPGRLAVDSVPRLHGHLSGPGRGGGCFTRIRVAGRGSCWAKSCASAGRRNGTERLRVGRDGLDGTRVR
eukprot:scaffold3170_cov269-Prasinococcus_capsulatus_cf.AAC.1